MFKALRRLFRGPETNETYVVVYDHGPNDDLTESYYGYFGSKEEAWRLFNSAFPQETKYYRRLGVRNAMLCKVVERW